MKRRTNPENTSSGDRIGTENEADDSAPASAHSDNGADTYASEKGKGGAPAGNWNALKHGASSKRARRGQRDRHRKAAERESALILKEMGLDGHPLARRLGMRLTDVETEIARLATYLEGKGRFDNRGGLRPAYARYLELQHQDRGEIRHLLDRLSEIRGDVATTEADAREKIGVLAARWPGALTYRIMTADGSDVTAAFSGARSPLAFDALPADAPALPAPPAALAPHVAVLDAHPLDRRDRPVAAPVPVEPRTITVETEEQRRYTEWAREMDAALDD